MSFSVLSILFFILTLTAVSAILVYGELSKEGQNQVLSVQSPSPSQSIEKNTTSLQSITPAAQLLELQYPNSTQVSFSEGEITYESQDSPADITNWYKEKIKDMGIKTISSVQTNTDGYILNKLVGSNGTVEIKITITKDREQTVSNITLEAKG